MMGRLDSIVSELEVEKHTLVQEKETIKEGEGVDAEAIAEREELMQERIDSKK